MGALPRPDVPPGPRRELSDALHHLHHRAGWPSLRALAHQAGCSHTTVSGVFSSPRLPSWGVLELLVEAMDGDTAIFRDLWLAASTPADGAPPVPRIAGRKAELTVVRRHLETGTGLLLVSGEAGIGKTRLVTTAANLATPDCFVAIGHCLPLSIEVPMLPIADALQRVQGVDNGQWFKEALTDCPPYVRGSIARLLPELATDAPQDPDEDGRHRLLTSLEAMLNALASVRPLAMLLEDLHWGDSATLDVLEYLLARRPGVPLVGTWRTEDVSTPQSTADWRVRVRRLPALTELALPPLSRDETAEQLALLEERTPEPGSVDLIHTRSQGHPLFTEQLASHAGDEQGLPSLLVDLLDVRLTGLNQAAWLIARALGVADRALSHAALASATGLPSGELVQGLHELHDHRLLSASTDVPGAQLRHPLLAEAIRRRLVPGEAAATHRCLALALTETEAPVAAEVARHWREAGDTAQELAWQVEAAEVASACLDRAQAAAHWLRALHLWPDRPSTDLPPVSRNQIALNAIQALASAGEAARSLALLHETSAWVDSMTVEEAAEFYARAGFLLGEYQDTPTGIAMFDKSIELYRQLPPCEGLAGSLAVRGMKLASAGRRSEALEAAREALDVARSVGSVEWIVSASAHVASHEAHAGRLEIAQQLIEEARSAMPPSGLWSETWVSEVATDNLLLHCRPLAEVEAAAEPGLASMARWGRQDAHASMLTANVAEALIRAGEVSRAVALLEPWTRGPVTLDRCPTHIKRALTDILSGDLGAASARLVDLEAVTMTWHLHRVARAEVATLAHLWSGRPAEAHAALEPLLADLADSDEVEFTGAAFVLALRALADRVESTPRAGAEVRGACASLALLRRRGGGDPLAPTAVPGDRFAQASSWNAEMARLEGKQTVRLWAVAAAEWDTLQRPHEAAYCRWRAAEVALSSGQAGMATKLLRRAARDAREHVPLSAAIRETAG